MVWHTQGSGKSYAMVFYVGKLRLDPRFANPTVVAVTDRTALDSQLDETFLAQRRLAPAVKQAESIADLHELLQTPAGRHRLHDDPEVPATQRRDADAGDLDCAAT